MDITNINVKMQLKYEYSEGLIDPWAYNKFIDLIDGFKPQSNYYMQPGDFDDRFSETMNNLFRSLRDKRIEEYKEEKNLRGKLQYGDIPKSDMAVLCARALNDFCDAVTYEKDGKTVSLINIASFELSSEMSAFLSEDYAAEAKSIINDKTKKLIGFKEDCLSQEGERE